MNSLFSSYDLYSVDSGTVDKRTAGNFFRVGYRSDVTNYVLGLTVFALKIWWLLFYLNNISVENCELFVM